MPLLAKEMVRSIIRQFGIDLRRYSSTNDIQQRRLRILKGNGISLVLDVGANIGQYARQLRASGYKGKIVSFEPMALEFSRLNKQAMSDSGWQCRHIALGDMDGTVEIQVAANSLSSSILPMCDLHVTAAPNSAYVGTERINIGRLDSLRSKLMGADDRVFLKLDVQGYEMKVLLGARDTLPQVCGIEIELSLVPLYEGQQLFFEMIEHLNHQDFDLVSIESTFISPQSGHTLQTDCIFVRNGSHPRFRIVQ